tara:strand:- start:1365 stop:1565 length:201 start_codon:yes stop_codon:yes gene_type:complete
MESLPQDQTPKNLDLAVSNVFHDLKCLGRDMTLGEIFDGFKELNKKQDLVMFTNGTVAATRKGLDI